MRAVILVVLVCCKSKAPNIGEPTATVSASASAAPSSPLGVVSASVAPIVSHYVRSKGCANATVAFAAARKFSVDKDWASAVDAFDEAVRGKPFDPHIWAERGYARLRAGDAAAAESDMQMALALTKDTALMAQIFFNLGDVFDALHQADASRVAFATAEQYGSTAAKTRLGAQSHCPASWKLGPGPATLTLVKGWLDLAKQRDGRCSAASDPKLSPRDRACRGCASPAEDRCAGPGPWKIDDDLSLGRPKTLVVVPLGSDTFFAETAVGDVGVPDVRADGGFARRRAPQMVGEHILGSGATGGALHEKEAFVTGDGKWSDEPAGSSCKPVLTSEVTLPPFDRSGGVPGLQGSPSLSDRAYEVTEWFDLATTKRVLAVTVYAGKVTATLTGKRVHLAGAGCSEDITVP